MMNLDMKI